MRLRTRLIAIIMALLMALTSPLQAFAEGEAANQAGPYLQDVYVAVAKTPDEAAKVIKEKGYEVLNGDDGKPADLNQGANSALKKDVAVVLGYKTTSDRSKAITDLAVMNMEGGFSFSSYSELMNQYRDSTIRPFIDRFMATVREYRANVESEDAGNRAKAEFARSLLNRIREDDTGKYLGDLLLQPTKTEMGDAYEGLTDDQKMEHIDLERALMQGNAEVVYWAERLLSYAADTADTTWLERLSAMGPDGLDAQYADMRPTDALNEQATKYQELATSLVQEWDEVRDELLLCDQKYSDAPEGDATAEGGDHEGRHAQSQVESESESDQQQSESIATVQEEQDEVDIAETLRLEVPELPDETREVSPEDVPELLSETTAALEAMNEASDDVGDTSASALYFFLKALPYGDGTLYDLFTLPASEVTGDNASRLYPAVSCLSAGQAAAIDFLPLSALLQIGATSGDAYATLWVDGLGLKEMAEASSEVSLYQGVNRDVFSDLTALTSDAMRADALRREDTGVLEFMSMYGITALLWTGAAVSAVIAGCSAYKTYLVMDYADTLARDLKTHEAILKKLQKTEEKLYDVWHDAYKKGGTAKDKGILTIRRTDYEEKSKWFNVKLTRTRALNDGEIQSALDTARIMGADITTDTEHAGNLNINGITEQLDKKRQKEATSTASKYFNKDSELKEGIIDFQDQINKLDEKISKQDKTIKKIEAKRDSLESPSWRTPVVWTIISVALTAAAIYSTVSDVMAYYHVKYAPMPLYIVDIADITTTSDNGTKTVVRNDSAYYTAVLSNAVRTGEDLKARLNYADLNGDKGKQWLGLYSARTDSDPILANSLKVVTGTSSIPDGYSTGIHMFGSGSAANLTDSRYCYNDDANGVYAYFKRDDAPAATASVFTNGSAALFGCLGLVVGTALGAGVMTARVRRREPDVTA